MSYTGCFHLQNFVTKKNVLEYARMYSSLIACNSEQALRVKASTSECFICYSRVPRLHACLSCVFIGCYEAKHIHKHAFATNHILAADMDHGFIYCFVCEDYTYNHELDHIATRLKKNFSKLLGIPGVLEDWYVPSVSETDILNWSVERKCLREDSYLGLRGLFNFGNTCYMNCILQVILHTPVLRNYFLSNPHLCKLEKNSVKSIVCELSSLFQEFYSGKIEVVHPSQFLTIFWTNRIDFAKNEQFDAQEFLLSLLDLLSEHCAGKTGMCTYYSDCGYSKIFHQIFSGITQSDLVCSNCRHVSPQKEFFWDTSLELSTTDNINNSGNSRIKTTKSSLKQCLQQFTSKECLECVCSNCNKKCNQYKQLSFIKLPYILTFHLKRFNRAGMKQKRDIDLSFPEVLDMTEFLFYSLNEKCLKKASDKSNNQSIKSDNRYYLFGVVAHKEATDDSGHYVAYIRHRKSQWFNCNDKNVTPADISAVMKSKAYLLFYHKELIEYE